MVNGFLLSKEDFRMASTRLKDVFQGEALHSLRDCSREHQKRNDAKGTRHQRKTWVSLQAKRRWPEGTRGQAEATEGVYAVRE